MTIQIVHLITGLQTGGAEHMLEKLVTGMDRRDFENIVVSLTGDGPVGVRLRAAGIAVHSLDMRSPAAMPLALLRLIRLLRRLQPQVLQTWLYHADLLGSLAYPTTGRTRLLWNLRCSDMNLADYPFTTRLVLRLLAMLSRLPQTIITNSEAGRRHHVALGYRSDGWITIPNGFDLGRFSAGPTGDLRRLLGLAADTPLVGMVGRHDPMKDHGNFLGMAERLMQRHANVHFVLIGRGCTAETPLLADGARRLQGRLHLLGERPDVAALLPDLDVFALTSAYGEGFPNVLGEALACGVPSVATDVGDAAAILGDCGLIVPPRDPQALADAVMRILAMPDTERAAWTTRMRQRAESHYSLPGVVARYEGLYRQAAVSLG